MKPMAHHLLNALLVMALCLGTGCKPGGPGGDGGPDAAGDGGVGGNAALTSLFEAKCAAEAACTCEAETEEACVAGLQTFFDGVEGSLTAAGLTFDPACAQTWITFYESLGCAELTAAVYQDVVCNMEICPIFHGTLPAGAPCVDYARFAGTHSDCDAGLRCASGTCRPGGCDLAEGATCSGTSVNFGDVTVGLCADPLFCDNYGTDLCATLPGAGQPCPSGYCASGVRCDAAGGWVCVQDPDVNEPCPNGFCISTAYCDQSDPTNPVCVAAADIGDPCMSGTCVGGAFCSMSTGLCEALRPDGAFCSSGYQCLAGECDFCFGECGHNDTPPFPYVCN